jgi:hypothetical protein
MPKSRGGPGETPEAQGGAGCRGLGAQGTAGSGKLSAVTGQCTPGAALLSGREPKWTGRSEATRKDQHGPARWVLSPGICLLGKPWARGAETATAEEIRVKNARGPTPNLIGAGDLDPKNKDQPCFSHTANPIARLQKHRLL